MRVVAGGGSSGKCPQRGVRGAHRGLPRALGVKRGLARHRPGRDRAHTVLGQGPGLVGADDIGGAEGLHGAQALDQRAPAGQRAHRDSQRQRDDRQQTLRHVSCQQADREHDAVLERQAGTEDRDRNKGDGHRDRDRGDQPCDPANLSLQGAGLFLDSLGQCGDAPQLGVHPGRKHDALRLPTGGTRAAEQEIPRGDPRYARIDQLRRAQRRSRLARERGEIHLEGTRDQAHVGGDSVALLDDHHVTGNQLSGQDRRRLSIAQDPDPLRQEVRQRLHRPLRLHLLHECEQGVEHDHQKDGDGDGLTADRERQRRREPQQQREWVGQLACQLTRPLRPPRRRNSLGPYWISRRRASPRERPTGEARRSRMSNSTLSVASTSTGCCAGATIGAVGRKRHPAVPLAGSTAGQALREQRLAGV